MIKFFRLGFVVIPIIALFISCSDSPSSVGGGLIQDQDKISFSLFDSQTENIQQRSFTYTPSKFKIGNGGEFIVGKNDYAESRILLHFSLGMPDSTWIKFKSNTIAVKSAQVKMITSYLLGDKNASFDFTVSQVKTPWNMYTVDKDSLSKLMTSNVDISSQHSFVADTITFNIDPKVVTEWLNAQLDTNNTRNYGIILNPTSGTKKIRGFANPFSSSTNYCTITFEMERIPKTTSNDFLSSVPSKGTFIVKELKTPATNNLYLQSGYSRRNFLWFDLAKLPKNIIVTKATLDMTADTTISTDGSPSSNLISVTMFADSSAKKFTSDSLYASSLKKSGAVYSGDISWIIQKWVSGTDNQGVELILSDETAAASRIAFYRSTESDLTKRPRLKIYYSKK